ncbi:hypothetical protein J6590_100897 [Homalodisca vitripennis]|nr:hypothetical protein J6590_100897 [Homalodisca vitripennis]
MTRCGSKHQKRACPQVLEETGPTPSNNLVYAGYQNQFIDITRSHHYPQLQNYYSLKWFYEKLVCYSSRPTNVVPLSDIGSLIMTVPANDGSIITKWYHPCGFICYLSSIMGEIFNDTSIPDPILLERLYQWGDELICEFHDDGYKAINMWESLLNSSILTKQNDPCVDSHDYRARMRGDFISSLGEHQNHLSEHYDLLTTMISGNPNYGVPLLTQLHGL